MVWGVFEFSQHYVYSGLSWCSSNEELTTGGAYLFSAIDPHSSSHNIGKLQVAYALGKLGTSRWGDFECSPWYGVYLSSVNIMSTAVCCGVLPMRS